MALPETLTYAEDVKGWPSFYSYLPEFMLGMNQYFYSFKGGNLYRHNTNTNRNEYYEVPGNLAPSTITTAFNTDPGSIKLFKTMSYESNDVWACTQLATDLSNGSMGTTVFRQKEGEWFAYLRENAGTLNLKDRSVNGVGAALLVSGVLANTIVRFPLGLNIGTIMSVGDIVYGSIGGVTTEYGPLINFGSNPVSTTAGIVQQFFIEFNATAAGVQPAIGDFMFIAKDPIAESHGARGYFMEFTLSNNNTDPVEIFAVNSNVMKSYP